MKQKYNKLIKYIMKMTVSLWANPRCESKKKGKICNQMILAKQTTPSKFFEDKSSLQNHNKKHNSSDFVTLNVQFV